MQLNDNEGQKGFDQASCNNDNNESQQMINQSKQSKANQLLNTLIQRQTNKKNQSSSLISSHLSQAAVVTDKISETKIMTESMIMNEDLADDLREKNTIVSCNEGAADETRKTISQTAKKINLLVVKSEVTSEQHRNSIVNQDDDYEDRDDLGDIYEQEISYEPKLSGGVQVIRQQSGEDYEPTSARFFSKQDQEEKNKFLNHEFTKKQQPQAGKQGGFTIKQTRQTLIPNTKQLDFNENSSQSRQTITSQFSMVRRKSMPISNLGAKRNHTKIMKDQGDQQISKDIERAQQLQLQALVVLGTGNPTSHIKQQQSQSFRSTQQTQEYFSEKILSPEEATNNDNPITTTTVIPHDATNQGSNKETDLQQDEDTNSDGDYGQAMISGKHLILNMPATVPKKAKKRSSVKTVFITPTSQTTSYQRKGESSGSLTPLNQTPQSSQLKEVKKNGGVVDDTSSTFFKYVERDKKLDEVSPSEKERPNDDYTPGIKTREAAVNQKMVPTVSPIQYKVPNTSPLAAAPQPVIKPDSLSQNKLIKSVAPVNVSFGRSPQPSSKPPLIKDQLVLKKNKASFIIKPQNEEYYSLSPHEVNFMKKLLPKDSSSLKKHVEEIESFNIRPLQKTDEQYIEKISKPKLTEYLEQKPSAISAAVEDQGSRNTIAKIQSLFGNNHAESRGLLNDLEVQMTRQKISVSQAQAIKMAKRPKYMPVLDKLKYRVDIKIEKESKINPLLVKQRPLELPQTVISEFTKQKKVIHAKKAKDQIPVMSRIQSQKEMLQNSHSSGLTFLQQAFGNSELSSNHHKSTSLPRQPFDAENIGFDQDEATPIFLGQQLLIQSPINQHTPERKTINISQIKEIKLKLAKQKQKNEMKARAHMALTRQDLQKEAAKQKQLQSMKETRLVQNSLNAVSQQKIKNSSNFHSQQEKPSMFKSNKALVLPRASSSVFQNLDLLKSIFDRIHEEEDSQKSSVKQISANLKLKAIAKQSTWQSTTSILQKRISEQNNEIQQKNLQKNPSSESLERIVRQDSAKRRMSFQQMNLDIKTSNMEKIYKLKSSSQNALNDQVPHQSSEKTQLQQPQYLITEGQLQNLQSQDVFSSGNSTPEQNEHIRQGSQQNEIQLQINSEKMREVLADVASNEEYSSQEDVESNKIYLPNINVGNNNIPINQDVEDTPNGFEAYQNILMQDTFDGRLNPQPETRQMMRPSDQEGKFVQSILSRRSNSQEQIRSAGASTLSQHDGTRGDQIHPDSIQQNMQQLAGISLAELVNLQTQQMMMLKYEDQTKEKWYPTENHNDNTSKASSIQTIGIPASAQFRITGNLASSDQHSALASAPVPESSEEIQINTGSLNAIDLQSKFQLQNEATNYNHNGMSLPHQIAMLQQQRNTALPSLISNQLNGDLESLAQVNHIIMPPNTTHGKAPLAPHTKSQFGKKLTRHGHQTNEHTSQSRLETQSQSQFGQLPSLLGANTAASGTNLAGTNMGVRTDSQNYASFKTLKIPRKNKLSMQVMAQNMGKKVTPNLRPSNHNQSSNHFQATVEQSRFQSIPRSKKRSYTPLKAFERSQLMSIAQTRLMADTSTEDNGSQKAVDDLNQINIKEEQEWDQGSTPNLQIYKGLLPTVTRNPFLNKPVALRTTSPAQMKYSASPQNLQQATINRSRIKSLGGSIVTGKTTTHKLQVSLSPNKKPQLNTVSSLTSLPSRVAVSSLVALKNNDVLILPHEEGTNSTNTLQNQHNPAYVLGGKKYYDPLEDLQNSHPVNIRAMKIEQQDKQMSKSGHKRGFRGSKNNAQGNLSKHMLYRQQMEQIGKQKIAEARARKREELRNYKQYIPAIEGSDDGGDQGQLTENYRSLIENDDKVFCAIEQTPIASTRQY